MFRSFERLVAPTARGAPGEPPEGLIRFYWFFLSQAKHLFAALLVLGLLLAIVDAAVPVFIGKLVNLVSSSPERSFDHAVPLLIAMAGFVFVLRPTLMLIISLVQHQAIIPGVTNLIRWQSHWHVVRQSLGFFQHDFAGRIASRVMETGYALRQSAVSIITVVWYLISLASAAFVLMLRADAWLALPMLVWIVAYLGMLSFIVPRVRKASTEIAYARSAVTGRIVDSYTNIMTVKLFARARLEDDYVRESVDWHTTRMRNQLRYFTALSVGLALLSGFLITTTGAVALLLWSRGLIGVEIVATVLPLTVQISGFSNRVAYEITTIFEQFGTVHEGMDTVAKPLSVTDGPEATRLDVTSGAIAFENVRFHYGRAKGVIEDLSLSIAPGEKIGLVGPSGAGKSTLVNLLLRFHDLEGGRILIDGQDIATVTQESLRERISVVTQDTSLLHRSIRANISYGRPDASEEDLRAAAHKAHAEDFIGTLEDWKGRVGYDAHVGERGVKLSGGQRQRIAIARVILKDAPILILDEATSALDSEIEAAIQEQLQGLMEGKTVIAIAHRLSTIARMDRLVILDHGRIVEAGSHAELLRNGGRYADLWRRQSGGFLAEDNAQAAE